MLRNGGKIGHLLLFPVSETDTIDVESIQGGDGYGLRSC